MCPRTIFWCFTKINFKPNKYVLSIANGQENRPNKTAGHMARPEEKEEELRGESGHKWIICGIYEK